MSSPSTLLPRSITQDFSSATISRAHAYCNQYSIKSMSFTPHASIKSHIIINSAVFGSGKTSYHQEIIVEVDLETNRLSSIVDADCSCPVGYFCKHIYAVVFMFNKSLIDVMSHLEKYEQKALAAPAPAHTPPSKKSTFNRAEFEAKFSQSLRIEQTAKPLENQKPVTQFIAYQLVPKTETNKSTYQLQASRIQILKNGNYSKPKKESLLGHIRGYSIYPDYCDIHDFKIFKLIQANMERYASTLPDVSGEYGAKLVQLLIESQRLFGKDLIEGQNLTQGADTALELEWTDINGHYRFSAKIHGKSNIQIIPTSPAFYSIDNKIGKITTPISGSQLMLLNELKDMDENDLSFVRHTIENSPLAQAITFPKKIKKLQAKKLTPTPIAHFSKGASVNWPHYGFFAEVSFDYDGTRLEPHQEGSPIVDLNGQLIEKNIQFERDKLITLECFGFKKSRRSYYGSNNTKPFGATYLLDKNPHLAPEDQWEDFYLNDLEELKLLGWQVEFAEGFNYHYSIVDEIDIGVEESAQNDWFNVHLTVNHNGNTIDLQPLIMQYLQKGLNKDEHDLIAIVDNNHRLRIGYEVIEPVIKSLFELNDDRGHGLKLSKWQVGALMSLEEQLGKSGSIDYSKAHALKTFVNSLKDISTLPLIPTPPDVKATLRDYQNFGVSWMDFLSKHDMGGLLADDMGLGKTLQTLTWLQLQKDRNQGFGPSLIIAPTSVVGNWMREAEKFTPKLKVLLLHGNDREFQFQQILKHDIVVTSYPLILKDEEVHQNVDYSAIILDEAQTIKNAKTKQAQTIFTLPAKQRFCLTGTPLENHLGELWSQFNFLMPGFLGNDAQFRKHFKNPIEKYQDRDRLTILKNRIAPFMLRRTKALVAKDLPEKTESIEIIELPNTQKQLYESVRMTMEKKVRELLKQQGLAKSHIHILDALLKLRQSCCHPQLVKLDSAKKVKESAKLEYLLEMLTELAEENRKVLVFSQFVEMLDIIAAELTQHKIKYVQLTGQTKNRQSLIDDFSNDSSITVFLISLKAGGTGLNLVAADTVVHFDPWWNPAVEAQATDRAYRIGQDKPVTVYKLIAKDSVEEKILKLQQKKADLASGLYNKDGQTDFKLNESDLLNLFEPIV